MQIRKFLKKLKTVHSLKKYSINEENDYYNPQTILNSLIINSYHYFKKIIKNLIFQFIINIYIFI